MTKINIVRRIFNVYRRMARERLTKDMTRAIEDLQNSSDQNDIERRLNEIRVLGLKVGTGALELSKATKDLYRLEREIKSLLAKEKEL